mgnify:CR=1 FL=1
MLSDGALNNLIQPLIDRQEALNMYIIETIAKRVREIGHLLPSDVYKLERLLKSGADVQHINSEIARITGLNESAVKGLIRTVAKDNYLGARAFYDYRLQPFIKFEQNEPLQRVVRAIAQQTADSYVNLSRSRAFMIRDLKNPQKLIPTSVSETYYSVIDEAIQASQSGVLDYGTAMRRTLEQLTESGLRTVSYYPASGKVYTQQLDVAVKRNILDGIRQVNQAVQDEVGKQFGADGKEISVHEHSAPDHEPIQGHQFTNEEYEKLQTNEPFEDVNGRKFEAIERSIGEYNCRHFTYSIIIGVNKPNFTQQELDKNIERNHKGYTDASGKHRTLYECTQEQRAMERKIRQAKRDIMAGKSAGNAEMVTKGRASLNKWQNTYKEFSKACGVSTKPTNTRVAGFRK